MNIIFIFSWGNAWQQGMLQKWPGRQGGSQRIHKGYQEKYKTQWWGCCSDCCLKGKTWKILKTPKWIQKCRINNSILTAVLNVVTSLENEIKNNFCQIVDSQPKSRMWYRIGATRNLTGGRKIMPSTRMSTQARQVWLCSNTFPLSLTSTFYCKKPELSY